MQDFTSNRQLLTNAVNGLHAGGGTNMNGGLLLAQQLLNNIPNHGNTLVVKNLLLLYDGMPNISGSPAEIMATSNSIMAMDVNCILLDSSTTCQQTN